MATIEQTRFTHRSPRTSALEILDRLQWVELRPSTIKPLALKRHGPLNGQQVRRNYLPNCRRRAIPLHQEATSRGA